MARSMISNESSWPVRPPNIMQPRHNSLTLTPVRPRLRYSMLSLLRAGTPPIEQVTHRSRNPGGLMLYGGQRGALLAVPRARGGLERGTDTTRDGDGEPGRDSAGEASATTSLSDANNPVLVATMVVIPILARVHRQVRSSQDSTSSIALAAWASIPGITCE